jgi:hypothetical protein
MVMDYEIVQVASNLIFIRWFNEPSAAATETRFLADLKQIVECSTQPVYFISDLRRGKITNVETLRRLGEMTRMHNWGGSSAFTDDSYTSLFVNLYSKYGDHSKEEVWTKPEQALKRLEGLCPGITAGIDWKALLES